MDNKTAGFVGLGHMGRPMADNLLRSGWDVTLWNRSDGALEDPENLGGRRTANVADMRDLPVIVFMLPDLPFIEAASAGLLESWRAAPPRAGTSVVVMSSVSPSGVQDFGREVQLASQGNAAVVDAPVSGGTGGAVDGTLAIMAGGTAADFRRLEPLFSAMGTTVRHMGALGAGSLAKACNQLIVGTTTAAVPMAAAGVELYAELKRQGLGDQDLAVVRQVISQLSDAHAGSATEGTVHERAF